MRIRHYNQSSDLVKDSQDNDFIDKILTNLDSITVNRNPTLDEEVSNKKYFLDEFDKKAFLRFNQQLQNYLKVSAGNDIYNLAKNDKIQIVGLT